MSRMGLLKGILLGTVVGDSTNDPAFIPDLNITREETESIENKRVVDSRTHGTDETFSLEKEFLVFFLLFTPFYG